MGEIDKYKWLFDDITNLKEKIRFKDRIEYRVSGQLHNVVGPAIIYFDSPETNEVGTNHYYINGLEYTEEDWNIKTRSVKLKKLKKKIEKKAKKI
jgi:hypothetical protein